MNGPHILYAWIAGAVLALADGLVYAQLGAALPGSGGGYLYLREAFQPFGLGRLMGVPLHLPDHPRRAALDRRRRGRLCRLPAVRLDDDDAAAAPPDCGLGVRRHRPRCCGATSRTIGRLAVVMLAGVLITVGWVIVAGLFTFSPAHGVRLPAAGLHLRRVAG